MKSAKKWLAVAAVGVVAVSMFGFSSDTEQDFTMNLERNPHFKVQSMPTKSEVVQDKFGTEITGLEDSEFNLICM